LKTPLKKLIYNHQTCLKHVDRWLLYLKLFKNSIKSKTVIPDMNMLTITINSLKNIYILLVCVYCSLLSSEINSQENITEIECNSTQYFYPSGKLSSEGCLFNGIPNGRWKSYYESGNIKSSGFWVENKLSGKWKFYNEDSTLDREIEYEADLKNGKEIIYFKNGNYKSVTVWVLNNKERTQTLFYKSGKIKYTVQYEADLKNGKTTEYAQDGRIITFKFYKKGIISSIEKFNRFNRNSEKSGIWKYFHENNRISEEGPYRNNLRHGVFRFYNTSGDLDNIVRYEFGIEVLEDKLLNKSDVITSYHNNGKISEETVYKNGLKNGVSRIFNTEGNIVEGNIFKDGIKTCTGVTDRSGLEQGGWELYYNDGSVKAIGSYENGKKVGEWKYFNKRGWLEQTGYYRLGKLDGVWKWMDESGFIIRLETYDNGLEEGQFIEYDSSNKLLLKGIYRNGLRVDSWFYHVNDHKELGSYLNGERDGNWIYLYSEKQKMFEGEYSFGSKEGTHKEWYPNGTLKSTGKYEGGVENGKWKFFTEEGALKYTYTYRYGKLWKVDGRRVARKRDSLRN
jgi:antitoxin component YwqK of YwqJK toxin-antitoxin module